MCRKYQLPLKETPPLKPGLLLILAFTLPPVAVLYYLTKRPEMCWMLFRVLVFSTLSVIALYLIWQIFCP